MFFYISNCDMSIESMNEKLRNLKSRRTNKVCQDLWNTSSRAYRVIMKHRVERISISISFQASVPTNATSRIAVARSSSYQTCNSTLETMTPRWNAPRTDPSIATSVERASLLRVVSERTPPRSVSKF